MKDQKTSPEKQPKVSETQALKKEQETKTVMLPRATEKTEVEKLREELATLKSQMAKEPLSLDEKIKFFQEKQAKINQLAKLDTYAESLIKIGQEAQILTESDEFFTEKFAVRISKKTGYRDEFEDLVKVHNPVLVVEMLGYALERINSKRLKLQSEINA